MAKDHVIKISRVERGNGKKSPPPQKNNRPLLGTRAVSLCDALRLGARGQKKSRALLDKITMVTVTAKISNYQLLLHTHITELTVLRNTCLGGTVD